MARPKRPSDIRDRDEPDLGCERRAMGRKEPNSKNRAERFRPKASENRITDQDTPDIAQAFKGIGGLDAMLRWAKKTPSNLSLFYSKIYPMALLPDQGRKR